MPPVNKALTVEVQMMIRQPASVVFNAIQDPAVTSKFWFTRGSDKLEKGKKVTWHWEMYGVSAHVLVKEVIPNEKIIIEWNSPPTTVEFDFNTMGDDATLVVIRNYGFSQEGDELLHVLKDSTGGFTTVLDGMKAYLEHNVQLNLVADKYPQKLSK